MLKSKFRINVTFSVMSAECMSSSYKIPCTHTYCTVIVKSAMNLSKLKCESVKWLNTKTKYMRDLISNKSKRNIILNATISLAVLSIHWVKPDAQWSKGYVADTNVQTAYPLHQQLHIRQCIQHRASEDRCHICIYMYDESLCMNCTWYNSWQ